MSISGAEVAVSVGAIATAFLLVQMGKTYINEAQILDGQNKTKDGINPNWNPGAKIERPENVDFGGGEYPKCQVWDENAQLFVPAGGDEARSSAEKCFSSFPGMLARYVGGDLVPKFNTKEPLAERDETKGGICYKWNGSQWTGNPGPGPINASDRLCFASGDSLRSEGALFANLNGPGQYYFVNPNFSYGDSEIPWTSMPVYGVGSTPIPAAGWYYGKYFVANPPKGRCEEKVGWEKYMFWAHTNDSSKNDGNIDACVNAGNGAQMRWREGNEIVYWDPYIEDLVKTTRPPLQ